MAAEAKRDLLAPFGATSPATAAFNEKIAAVFAAAPSPQEIDIPAMRALRAAGQGVLPIEGPLPEGSWLELGADAAPGGAQRIRLVRPDGPVRGVYLFIHGGGWTFGAPEEHDGSNLKLARTAGVEVLSAAYRLAPEHPWPACAEDCLAAARFALRRAQAANVPFFIGGASAGAHLAATVLQLLKRADRLSEVAASVLIYGMFDLRMTPSAAQWGPRQLVLSTPVIEWFVGNLLPDRSMAQTPEVSPLHADWSGAPHALFQVGAEDPLLDDTLFLAERWRAAGANAELIVFPGGIHAFDVFDDPKYELPIAGESQAATATFLDERLKACGR